MFAYPATEIYKAEDRRVVWSVEEYEAALAEGWSDEKPAQELAAKKPGKK